MSTARRHLKSPQSLSGTSAQQTMVTLVNIMVTNEWLTSFSLHVNRPSHSCDKNIPDSDLETPRSRSRSRSRSYIWPSILLICLLFISHQWDKQILRYSYFEIWRWNIQVQGHGGDQRSSIILSIQPMHFLFISHESDQPFWRYGQNSVWPWKNASKFFKENLPKLKFQQNFFKI